MWTHLYSKSVCFHCCVCWCCCLLHRFINSDRKHVKIHPHFILGKKQKENPPLLLSQLCFCGLKACNLLSPVCLTGMIWILSAAWEWFVFSCLMSNWWITVSVHIRSVGSVFLCFALKISEVVSIPYPDVSFSVSRSPSLSLSLSLPHSCFRPLFVSISFALSLNHGCVCVVFFLSFPVDFAWAVTTAKILHCSTQHSGMTECPF